MPAIESAIRKYGTAPARRKASLHDGVQPHFQPKRTTVEDAQRQLAEIAKLAF
jgi:hypothetical protein